VSETNNNILSKEEVSEPSEVQEPEEVVVKPIKKKKQQAASE
jgi:hypothetical protein